MNRALFALVTMTAAAAGFGACSSNDDSQSVLPRSAMLDPETCKTCHADHYREWSGSMHAYAADDPVFLAMNKRGQRETAGALGDFCVKCHAPMAVREGATKDGLNLDTVPRALKGVTCFFCHSVDAVEGTHNGALHVSDDLVMRGGFADPVANTAHRAGYSHLHDRDKVDSAAMCGTCHDIVTNHGAALERTFSEWQASVFSHAPGGATCGQCHMAQGTKLEPVAQAPNVFARRRHSHTFPGVDVALTPFPETDAQKSEVKSFLDSTLQSALCVSTAGGTQMRVLLDNVGSGHSFPSGASQDRRVFTEVIAYAGANVVYQSGVLDPKTAIVHSTDPDLWLMRDCIFDPSGAEAHMFWEVASTEGNALLAQVTFDALDPRFFMTHIERIFPRTGTVAATADRVTLRVRVQPMGKDVLDDLVTSGDLDATLIDKMPTHDVGDLLEWTAAGPSDTVLIDRIPYACVTKTNFNVRADKVPAKEHVRCKP